MASRIRGTRHADLYQGLRLIMNRLGNEAGCPELGIACLGSFLWHEDATADIQTAELPNVYLLSAVRALAFSKDGGVRRVVNYRNLGAET